MQSREMTELVNYKGLAKCTKGSFKGLHATKNEKGHVILVEEDVAYDFWDSRFVNCSWEIIA
jgi:hypothetical protein